MQPKDEKAKLIYELLFDKASYKKFLEDLPFLVRYFPGLYLTLIDKVLNKEHIFKTIGVVNKLKIAYDQVDKNSKAGRAVKKAILEAISIRVGS